MVVWLATKRWGRDKRKKKKGGGSFNTGVLAILNGGTKSFTPIKGGGGGGAQRVLPCLEGGGRGATSFGPAIFPL